MHAPGSRNCASLPSWMWSRMREEKGDADEMAVKGNGKTVSWGTEYVVRVLQDDGARQDGCRLSDSSLPSREMLQ